MDTVWGLRWEGGGTMQCGFQLTSEKGRPMACCVPTFAFCERFKRASPLHVSPFLWVYGWEIPPKKVWFGCARSYIYILSLQRSVELNCPLLSVREFWQITCALFSFSWPTGAFRPVRCNRILCVFMNNGAKQFLSTDVNASIPWGATLSTSRGCTQLKLHIVQYFVYHRRIGQSKKKCFSQLFIFSFA